MLIGQTILAPGNAAAVYYTPWFPRQGDAFTIVIETMLASGAYVMTVEVQTKNQQDSDATPTILGSTFNITSTVAVTTTALRTGALELVRYKFSLLGGSSTTRWVHFRANAPQWQPN